MGVWSPLDDLDDKDKKRLQTAEVVKKHPTVEDLEKHDSLNNFASQQNYSTIVFSDVQTIGEQIEFPEPAYTKRAQQIRRIYLNGSPELKTPRSSRPVTAATTKSLDVMSDGDRLKTPATPLDFPVPINEEPGPHQVLKKVLYCGTLLFPHGVLFYLSNAFGLKHKTDLQLLLVYSIVFQTGRNRRGFISTTIGGELDCGFPLKVKHI